MQLCLVGSNTAATLPATNCYNVGFGLNKTVLLQICCYVALSAAAATTAATAAGSTIRISVTFNAVFVTTAVSIYTSIIFLIALRIMGVSIFFVCSCARALNHLRAISRVGTAPHMMDWFPSAVASSPRTTSFCVVKLLRCKKVFGPFPVLRKQFGRQRIVVTIVDLQEVFHKADLV